MPRPHSLHFLGWKKPASVLVAQKLLQQPDAQALILVPTKEAARLLKEQLALQSAEGGARGACLSPRIIPNNQLLALCEPSPPSEVEELFSWMECLRQPDHRNMPLFAASSAWKEQSWLYQAQQFQELFAHLSRDAVHWQSIEAGQLGEEQSRWRSLLYLKSQQVKQLHRLGYNDSPQPPQLQLAAGSKIILACVPQLSKQHQEILTASGHPLEIWVHAPTTDRERFDPWGRPLDSWLLARPSAKPAAWTENITLCPNSWSMAQQAVQLAGQLNAQEGGTLHSLALCNAEADKEACLEECFSTVGVTTHRPRGYSMHRSAWYHLLTQLSSLEQHLTGNGIAFSNHDFYPSSTVMELHNNPLLGFFLQGADFSNRAEKQNHLLSRIQSRCFPTRLAGITKDLSQWTRYYPRETQYEPDAQQLLAALRQLCVWLEELFASASSLLEQLLQLAASPSTTAPSALHESYTQSMIALCEQARALWAGRRRESAALALSFLLLSCDKLRCTPKRDVHASLDIMGWRDLPYSAARQLVITAFHDSALPEKWGTEAWLTPHVRQQLQLRSDNNYAAHDAYLLQSILASRQEGAVHFLLCQQDSQANPLAPSRLFFAITPKEQLPALVQKLFGEQQLPQGNAAEEELPLAWQYRQIPNPAGIPLSAETLAKASLADMGEHNPIKAERGFSPSMLKSFLSCPLRFWLRELYHINTQEQESQKREFNAIDLGNIIHESMESFIRRYPNYARFASEHPELPTEAAQLDITHLAPIREALILCLDSSYQRHYPHESLIPQQLQYKNMQEQIASYAPIQLQLWKEGWYTPCDEDGTLLLEYKPPNWHWEGYKMNVKIDRIDCREGPHGLEMRVIDYKTGSLENCVKQHLSKIDPDTEELPSLISPHFVEVNDKAKKPSSYRWTDLQLPLYAAWVEQEYPHAQLSAAYIKLSRKVDDNKLLLWDENIRGHAGLFSPDHTQFETAKSWMLGCMQLIREGRCLVSAELMGWDIPYDSLFGEMCQTAPLQELFIQSPAPHA